MFCLNIHFRWPLWRKYTLQHRSCKHLCLCTLQSRHLSTETSNLPIYWYILKSSSVLFLMIMHYLQYMEGLLVLIQHKFVFIMEYAMHYTIITHASFHTDWRHLTSCVPGRFWPEPVNGWHQDIGNPDVSTRNAFFSVTWAAHSNGRGHRGWHLCIWLSCSWTLWGKTSLGGSAPLSDNNKGGHTSWKT